MDFQITIEVWVDHTQFEGEDVGLTHQQYLEKYYTEALDEMLGNDEALQIGEIEVADPYAKERVRFWEKVATTDDPNDCWLWQGAVEKNGYGVFSFKGQKWYAHRVSFILAHGDWLTWSKRNRVTHLCESSGCVNPGHLSVEG